MRKIHLHVNKVLKLLLTIRKNDGFKEEMDLNPFINFLSRKPLPIKTCERWINKGYMALPH